MCFNWPRQVEGSELDELEHLVRAVAPYWPHRSAVTLRMGMAAQADGFTGPITYGYGGLRVYRGSALIRRWTTTSADSSAGRSGFG
jgi:hypothetical protein